MSAGYVRGYYAVDYKVGERLIVDGRIGTRSCHSRSSTSASDSTATSTPRAVIRHGASVEPPRRRRSMSEREEAAVDLTDTLMTWPSLTVQLDLAPWHWRLIPRVWTDWDITSSCSFQWLMVKVEWWANRPLFPVERKAS